jgi:protein dithiol:quinone oxidoreductase
MTLRAGPARLFLAAAALSLGVVGAALVTQHVLGMLPCPWCVLQRLLFVGIGAAALLGAGAAVLERPKPAIASRAAAAVMLMGALAGAAAALWQHFVAASSTSCKLTLADRIIAASGLDALWPEVFGVWASCADAAVKLLALRGLEPGGLHRAGSRGRQAAGDAVPALTLRRRETAPRPASARAASARLVGSGTALRRQMIWSCWPGFPTDFNTYTE